MNLRQLRKKTGLTQKQVADYLGIDRTSYVKYETGTSSPTMQSLMSLSILFGVSIDAIVGINNQIPQQKQEPPNPTADAVRTAFIEADPITQGIVCDILHVQQPSKKTADA